MSIIDRSPGGFIIIANTVLYSTVLAETGMLVSGSLPAMIAVMALIVAIAGGLCAFIMRLMGSGAYILGDAEKPVGAVAPAAQGAQATSRPVTASLTAFGRTPSGVASS